MIDQPTTRSEARTNAIEAMKQGFPATAQVWAQIALAFPEEPNTITIMADDRPIGADVERRESPSAVLRHAGRSTDTIQVSSVAWDVMRTLAAQYVNTSLNREAMVNLRDDFSIGISETDLIMSEVEPGVFRVMLVPRT